MRTCTCTCTQTKTQTRKLCTATGVGPAPLLVQPCAPALATAEGRQDKCVRLETRASSPDGVARCTRTCTWPYSHHTPHAHTQTHTRMLTLLHKCAHTPAPVAASFTALSPKMGFPPPHIHTHTYNNKHTQPPAAFAASVTVTSLKLKGIPPTHIHTTRDTHTHTPAAFASVSAMSPKNERSPSPPIHTQNADPPPPPHTHLLPLLLPSLP